MAPSARKPQPSLPTMQRFTPFQVHALGALLIKNGADAKQVMLQLKRQLTRDSFVSALWPALTQRVTPVASCLLVLHGKWHGREGLEKPRTERCRLRIDHVGAGNAFLGNRVKVR